MFKIKICGVTNSIDALALRELGADAIGLNFYQRSLRSVTLEQALQILSKLENQEPKWPSAKRLMKVGVFVSQSAAEINQIAQECDLDYVQLHGDQPLEIIQDLETTKFPIIRAIPWTTGEQVTEKANQWLEAGAQAVLLDSVKGKQFGGTGQSIDWAEVAKLQLSAPIILAGGLTPKNVQEAIRISGIHRVDTASGVESLPGKKDPDLLREFVHNSLLAINES